MWSSEFHTSINYEQYPCVHNGLVHYTLPRKIQLDWDYFIGLYIRMERHHLERILLDAMYQERQNDTYNPRCLKCVSKSKSNKNWTLYKLLLPFTLCESWQNGEFDPTHAVGWVPYPSVVIVLFSPEGEVCVHDQGTHWVYGVPRFFFHMQPILLSTVG